MKDKGPTGHCWVLSGTDTNYLSENAQGYPSCLASSAVPKILTKSALLTSIQDLLLKGTIKFMHTQNSLGFHCRLFLVLRQLQEASYRPKFFEQIPDDTKIQYGDLTDAYLYLPIHTQSQKYLKFCHKGIMFQFTTSPFGLATAPLVFTSLVKEVKLLALQQRITNIWTG